MKRVVKQPIKAGTVVFIENADDFPNGANIPEDIDGVNDAYWAIRDYLGDAEVLDSLFNYYSTGDMIDFLNDLYDDNNVAYVPDDED